jgi:hypothetical protein
MTVDLSKLASRVEDSTEPIKRTADRSGEPNPFDPMLSASWDARTARGHNGAEIGATKQIRAYTDEQTTAIVRALRRASETLGLGVKIDAPTEKYQEDGKDKTRYVAGTVRFEAMKRQERKRKDEQTSADESESADQDAGAEDEKGDDALSEGSDAGAQEPAWTS